MTQGVSPSEPRDDLRSAAYTAMATIDGQGLLTGWSEGAHRLLGYRAETVLRTVAASLLVESPDPEVVVSLAGREWWSRIVPLRHQDGTRVNTGLLAHRRVTDDGSFEWRLTTTVTDLQPPDAAEQSHSRQRLVLLNDVNTRIGTTLDIRRTAQELVEVAVPDLADFACVDLLPFIDQGDEPPSGPVTGVVTLQRAAQASVREGVPEAMVGIGATAMYPAFSPPAECLVAGHAAKYEMTDSAVTRWAEYDPPRADRIRAMGTHSVMVAPIRARGITLGVVVFNRHQRPEPFAEDDVLLAEEIASRAAVCIDNARRYTRERTTAMTLQRSLLPRALPDQAALEIASRYLPTGGQIGVGGDWFDAIPLSGARVALAVGDVVGHGLQASATMGRLRTAMRTLADIDLAPDELLTHLDDLVAHFSANEDAGVVGATCLYGVYDPVTRRCVLARAGHPPPVVVTPDGTASVLELPAAAPLGLGGQPFESVEIELPEGSLVAFYTDGLIHSRRYDIDERTAKLLDVVGRPSRSLDAVCDAVLQTLLPERPEDDVALLVARTRALSAEQVSTWDVPSDPSAVAEVRANVIDKLATWGLDELAFTTELVVSELVTNAIRYGQSPIQLRLIHDRSLICEVSDTSSTAPHLRRAQVFDEGGRGLLLVAQLTQRWGSRHTRTGKTIWAEQFLSHD